MTQTIMTKNVFYAVMMVSSFGVYSVSLAMDKESVVTRAEDNYLPTAKQNLGKAEKVNQRNLTAIKYDIKTTEKKLQIQPMNLDQDVFPVVEDRTMNLHQDVFSVVEDRNSDNSFLKRKRIDLTDTNKKEQSKKARQEKQAEKKLAEDLVFKKLVDAKLNELNEYYNSFDNVQLVEEVAKKPSMRRSKSKTSRNITNNQPIVFDNDINFEPVLDNSSPIMLHNQNDSTVLRRDNLWTPSATRNLNAAVAGNMENTTALKSMLRHNEKIKAKKTRTLNLDSSSSSEDKS